MLSFKREASGEPPPWMEDRLKNCSKEKVHLSAMHFVFLTKFPLSSLFSMLIVRSSSLTPLHAFFAPQPNNLIVWIMSNYDKTILRVNIIFFTSSTFCALVAIASPWHNGATALTFLAKRGAPIPFSDEIHFLYSWSSPTTHFSFSSFLSQSSNTSFFLS